MALTEHEEQFIRRFLLAEKQDRYRFLLDSPPGKRRSEGMDRLNHCADLDPRYTTWLPSNADVAQLLKQGGSPDTVYLISASNSLDGRTMALESAVELLSQDGGGTIVSCIPGRLAYYYEEDGARRAILKYEPVK